MNYFNSNMGRPKTNFRKDRIGLLDNVYAHKLNCACVISGEEVTQILEELKPTPVKARVEFKSKEIGRVKLPPEKFLKQQEEAPQVKEEKSEVVATLKSTKVEDKDKKKEADTVSLENCKALLLKYNSRTNSMKSFFIGANSNKDLIVILKHVGAPDVKSFTGMHLASYIKKYIADLYGTKEINHKDQMKERVSTKVVEHKRKEKVSAQQQLERKKSISTKASVEKIEAKHVVIFKSFDSGVKNVFNATYKYIQPSNNIVECVMISERHKLLNGKTPIFKNQISEQLMFDYGKQEEIIEQWIDTHLTKNEKGEYINTLKVLVTGLTSIYGSILKVCMEKEIPLIFGHWNTQTKTYMDQVMIPPKKESNLNSFVDVMYKNLGEKPEVNRIYFTEQYYNKASKNSLNVDKIYQLSLIEYTDKNEFVSRSIVYSDSYEDIMDQFVKLTKLSINGSKRLSIYMDITSFTDGKQGKCISICKHHRY